MKIWLPMLALPLVLIGCSSNQKTDYASCLASATAQTQRQDGEADSDYADALGPNIKKCMAAAGYHLNTGAADCDSDVGTGAECYAPNSVWKRLFSAA